MAGVDVRQQSFSNSHDLKDRGRFRNPATVAFLPHHPKEIRGNAAWMTFDAEVIVTAASLPLSLQGVAAKQSLGR
jgi:hypothetical protein